MGKASQTSAKIWGWLARPSLPLHAGTAAVLTLIALAATTGLLIRRPVQVTTAFPSRFGELRRGTRGSLDRATDGQCR